MQIDDRTKARLDQERNAKCRALAERIERHVATFNEMMAEAAELDLSIRIEAEQKRAAEGRRAFSYVLHVSCAQILP